MKSPNISDREQLRSLVDDSGMSRAQLCEQLDVSKRTLEYWLTGQICVPKMAILALQQIRALQAVPR